MSIVPVLILSSVLCSNGRLIDMSYVWSGILAYCCTVCVVCETASIMQRQMFQTVSLVCYIVAT